MKHQFKKARQIALIMLSILIVLTLMVPAVFAQEKLPVSRTVKVGWFEQPGYMEKQKDGSYSGYNYEYLQSLSGVNRWKYEFVEGNFAELYEKLKQGEIDLLGCTFKTEERMKEVDFPDLSSGMEYLTLFTATESPLAENDYEAFDQMTVGAIESSNTAKLQDFAQDNHFSVDIKIYDTIEDVRRAVVSQEVDAGLTPGYQNRIGVRSIASFSPNPFYFITSKGNDEILSELNRSMNAIKVKNPYFDEQLRQRFIQRDNLYFTLTQKEKEFLQNAPVYRVAYGTEWQPFESTCSKCGEFKGIVADVFTRITELTGLEFSYYETNVQNALDSQPDLIASLDYNLQRAEKIRYNLTDIFLQTPMVMVKKSGNAFRGGKIAVSDFTYSSRVNTEYQYEVVSYPTAEECILAVQNGQADQAIVTAVFAQQVMKKKQYQELSVAPLQGYNYEACIAVSKEIDPILISIINKCIAQISDAEMNDMIMRNTIDAQTINLISLIDQMPMDVVLVFVAILLLLVFTLLIFLRNQVVHGRRIKSVLYYDGLTGLLSEVGFEYKVRRVLKSSSKKHYMVDFDMSRFGGYNELYGSEQADLLLKKIAQISLESLHKNEFCARIYADHFVIFLQSETDEEAISRVNNIDVQFCSAVKDQSILLYYGIYEIKDKAIPVRQMTFYAAVARKRIKKSSDQHISLYDAHLHHDQMEQDIMLSEFESAICQHQFEAYYQPKYDTASGKIIGAEALVRWNRSNQKQYLPQQFIPLFEANGQIVRMDFYMLHLVCQRQRKLLEQGTDPIPIAVNFSQVHLYDENFANKLVLIVEQYQIPKSLIEIEFTETAIANNIHFVRPLLEEIRKQGFVVCMDDFGSGYSSLNTLKDLPLDVVKLDRAFVLYDTDKEKAQMIIRTVIALAKALKLKVVAEGIETCEQAAFLKECGCDMIQGYYFSKPITESQFDQLLQET